ncbi:MAG TPA: ATP-dependent DNA ligase [Polyangiaceae bacterium]
MKLEEVARASRDVAQSRARSAKIERLALVLRALAPEEVEAAVGFLSGEPRQGRLGIGGAALRRLWGKTAASEANATVMEVDEVLARVATASGKGSSGERDRLLAALFARLTADEQDFVGRLMLGELRQGALEGILVDALSKAARVPAAHVRRAVLFAGSFGQVALAAITEGEPGLARFSLSLFRPLRPMLADTAADVTDALARTGPSALEYKLDGARIQVHRAGGDVRVYSRQGNDVTSSVPDLVDSALALPVREIVLDGEAIALDSSGRPLAFQTTMRRFGRRLNVEALRAELPLSSFYFDVLHVDGETLVDRPNAERVAALMEHAPSELIVPRTVVETEPEARAFIERALSIGHEGVLVKSLTAPYDAGRRGASWLKLKPAHTLDLVVLAAEWGHGRRQGLLSNLHLGARDAEGGGFVMLGKTFKGLTDELLAWQTEQLLQRQTERRGHVVFVRPELVVEIAFDGVQRSSQYPGGMALRFARVKRYRADKTAAEADTIAAVREIFARSPREGEPKDES